MRREFAWSHCFTVFSKSTSTCFCASSHDCSSSHHFRNPSRTGVVGCNFLNITLPAGYHYLWGGDAQEKNVEMLPKRLGWTSVECLPHFHATASKEPRHLAQILELIMKQAPFDGFLFAVFLWNSKKASTTQKLQLRQNSSLKFTNCESLEQIREDYNYESHDFGTIISNHHFLDLRILVSATQT